MARLISYAHHLDQICGLKGGPATRARQRAGEEFMQCRATAHHGQADDGTTGVTERMLYFTSLWYI